MSSRRSTSSSVKQSESTATKAEKWVASPEGQQALAAGLEQAKSMTDAFRTAQQIDHESLDKPVTL